MGLIVQKFGGTSVGSIERIKHVARLIEAEVKQGNQIVTVVSAMGKSTDQLVDMALQITSPSVSTGDGYAVNHRRAGFHRTPLHGFT